MLIVTQIWKDTQDGGKEAHGYTLSMKRIVDLACREVTGRTTVNDE